MDGPPGEGEEAGAAEPMEVEEVAEEVARE
jgi:hypothetical protein